MKQLHLFLFILSIAVSSFSQVPMNWVRDEINPGEDFTLMADESFFTEGARSLKMTLHTGAVPYLVSDVFYVTPGADYEFSINMFDNDTSGQVKVYADFYDTYGFNIFGQPPVFSADSSQWQAISWQGTIPAQAVAGYILVKFYCQPDLYHFVKEAETWIDDVQFVQEGGFNLVANGGLEEWNVGIDDMEDGPRLIIYPNPAKDFVMIELPRAARQVTLSDMTGRIVFSEKDELRSTIDIGLGGWPPGLYLVTIYLDDNTFICRKFSKS